MMADKDREAIDDRTGGPLGGAPETPAPDGDDIDAVRDRCENDRESLSPRQTADCAGTDLAELYENEEDGGS